MKVTVANGAELGLVKPDHLCVFGANLNLFVELQTQRNDMQIAKKKNERSILEQSQGRAVSIN